jgi:TPP-dependent pyruvate/acetoin dehydrogenase alpha subunit
MDHVGGHLAKFQQWDAGKRQWKVASDWIEGDVALSQAIIDEGAEKYATQIELDLVDKSIKERVAECEKFAESSPYPDLTLMYDAVYEQENYPFIKHKL